MLFNPSISAIGHWFSKRRALATGIACTAGGTGGVVFPIIIIYLTPRLGFAWAVRVIGLICMVASIAACALLRKRLPHNKKAGAAVDLRALSDTRYAVTTAATFLIEFAVFIPYTYISSYAIHMGLPTRKAYLLNALLNVGAIPGRAIPGYLADRFGVFNVMCMTAAVCATFILALWLTATHSGKATITSFTVLYGFWSGAAISLTPVCIGAVCRTEDYGKRNGTTFSLTSIGALVGIPLAGAILQAEDGGYRGLIILSGVAYAAAAGTFALARGLVVGWHLGVSV
jgi:predicted MFS family arabinose efflux permease